MTTLTLCICAGMPCLESSACVLFGRAVWQNGRIVAQRLWHCHPSVISSCFACHNFCWHPAPIEGKTARNEFLSTHFSLFGYLRPNSSVLVSLVFFVWAMAWKKGSVSTVHKVSVSLSVVQPEELMASRGSRLWRQIFTLENIQVWSSHINVGS